MSVVISGLVKATFPGRNGSGTISVPGLKAGDVVLNVTGGGGIYTAASNGGTSPWEFIISVDDEIQQIQNADFSPVTIEAVLFRG
jgi:hypothetical protein